MCYTGALEAGKHPNPLFPGSGIWEENWPYKTGCYESGGTSGADAAFEGGCDQVQGRKEIFLPWKNFNANRSPLFLCLPQFDGVSEIDILLVRRAIELALKIHPLGALLLAPSTKMQTILKLMTRNSQQVLGKTVTEENKSRFLICWTRKDEPKGGTRQAIVLAAAFNIPVFNLGVPSVVEGVRRYLQS